MQSQNIWYLIGVLLFAWVGYDIYNGSTLLHRVIYKAEEPMLYWTGIAVWAGIALSCFISPSNGSSSNNKEN